MRSENRLAIAFLQAPIGDDDFSTGSELPNFLHEHGLFRRRGFFQLELPLGELGPTISATFDLLMTIANSTHNKLLAQNGS
jgi:hypothetical protein